MDGSNFNLFSKNAVDLTDEASSLGKQESVLCKRI